MILQLASLRLLNSKFSTAAIIQKEKAAQYHLFPKKKKKKEVNSSLLITLACLGRSSNQSKIRLATTGYRQYTPTQQPKMSVQKDHQIRN